jgi:hypothetical protein
MRLTTKAGWWAMGALAIAGFILWPGCIAPQLPPSRTPLSSKKRSDFSTSKIDHASRAQVTVKVGPADVYFDDLRVSCYKLNTLTRRKLWLFLGIIPFSVTREPDGLEFAVIQFDEHEQAQRIGTISLADSYLTIPSMGLSPERAPLIMRKPVEEWLKTTDVTPAHGKH